MITKWIYPLSDLACCLRGFHLRGQTLFFKDFYLGLFTGKIVHCYGCMNLEHSLND